ncbi:MAG TPA: Ig-like domain-containing protein, partial [Thermodesulfovibrionales bacterium]|nr:Ig-like domain-containing protein [Thermodesulfovibrionales bacterium]
MGVKYFRKLSTIIPTLLFLLALSSQALGDDTTPAVISASPTGASVPLNSIITITWSEDIDCSTVNTDNITISGGSGLLSSNCSGSQATFTTYGQTFSTNYTVTVAAGVTDLAGNPMTSPYSWNFTTQPDIFDTSFNSTGTIPGIVTYSGAAGGNNDYGYSITTDSSGNILVTGESDESEDNSEMVIWRYKPDGTLDTSFNSSGTKPGIVTYSGATGGNYDYGYSITTDSSHNILVTGASTNASGNQHMAIWRYNTNGMPDTSFNGTGIVVSPGAAEGNSDTGNSITTDSSGKILVTGYSWNESDPEMVIWRYNPDGTLDTTFNGTGIVVSDNMTGANGDQGNSIALDTS